MQNHRQMIPADDLFRRFANVKLNTKIQSQLGDGLYSYLIKDAQSYYKYKRLIVDVSIVAAIALYILSINFLFFRPSFSLFLMCLGSIFALPFGISLQNEPTLDGPRLLEKSEAVKDEQVICQLFLKFVAFVDGGEIKCYRRLKRFGRVTYRAIEARHFSSQHRWLELFGKERGRLTIVPKFWDPGSRQVFVDEDQVRQNLAVAGEFALNQVYREPAALVRLNDFQRQGLRLIVEKIGCLDDVWDSAFRAAEKYHHEFSERLQKKAALLDVSDGLRDASPKDGEMRAPKSVSYIAQIVMGKNKALNDRLSVARSKWLILQV